MSTYTLQTPESAAETARPVLEKARGTLGFVPNLYAGLANAPEALLAYISLSGHFDNTSLTPQERQTVLLVASVENRIYRYLHDFIMYRTVQNIV